VEEVRVLPKPRALAVGPSGLEEVEVSDPRAQSVSDETAVEVARLSLRAEEAIGSPVEVEWALVNNEVRLLTARPLPEELVRT
jgi:pyruvate,water dikinase